MGDQWVEQTAFAENMTLPWNAVYNSKKNAFCKHNHEFNMTISSIMQPSTKDNLREARRIESN